MHSWIDDYVEACNEHAWIVLRDQLKFDFEKFKQVRGHAGPRLNVEDADSNRIVLTVTTGFTTKWINVIFDNDHIRTNDSANYKYREIHCKRTPNGNHLLILDGEELGFKEASHKMLWPLIGEYLPS